MQPYTYLIRWPQLNISYYGVRYAKDCDPGDLWNPYKTSSIHVKNFILENGEPTIIQVRKVFNDIHTARLWENRVLKRIKVVSDPRWLNKTDNKSIEPLYGEDHPHYGKTGPAHHSYSKSNKKASEAQKRRWANPDNKNPMRDPEVVARKVAKTSGDKHHMKRPEIVEKVSGKNNWIYQKPGALEERSQRFIEMNKARKGTHYRKVVCQYCKRECGAQVIKRHENYCKSNLTSLVANTDSRVYNQL